MSCSTLHINDTLLRCTYTDADSSAAVTAHCLKRQKTHHILHESKAYTDYSNIKTQNCVTALRDCAKDNREGDKDLEKHLYNKEN